jgi:hypothetical protein
VQRPMPLAPATHPTDLLPLAETNRAVLVLPASPCESPPSGACPTGMERTWSDGPVASSEMGCRQTGWWTLLSHPAGWTIEAA